jgi:pyridoxine 5-phosphate synthase
MRLGVNVDHVATLRQQRRGTAPDPVEAARVCEQAGATSIVCHLREDRRHIQDRDVERLRRGVATRLNLEMSLAPDVVRAALRIRPDEVTLVPERRQELTTEGGLDARRLSRRLAPLIKRFHAAGIEVSLFIDPVAAQWQAAKAVGARTIELHTGRYAEAGSAAGRARELRALQRASAQARRLGLTVAAGHGLDYENVGPVAAIPDIEELNIGYAIITRAVWVGLEQAVREMAALLAPRRAHAGVAA